jgi:uncharacterized protein
MIVLATVIIAAAAALQAATGMGMALLAVPLLALIDPAYVPGPTLCAVMVLSAGVAWRERLAIDRRLLAPALFGLAAGCGIGATVLALLAGVDLARLFAILILGAVALSISGARAPTGPVTLLIGGTAAGILGTMSGAHGPPIALVLQHEPPARLRATLCAFFAVGCAVSLLALAVGGLLGSAQLRLGAGLLPGVAIGFALAPPLSRRLDRQRARAAVLAISALSAFALLLR